MNWVAEVLVLWFTELDSTQWFKPDPALDRQIGECFGETHQRVVELPDETLLRDADTALAAIVVLDQFSRNMYRGTPRAFAHDEKALRLADEAIFKGYDVAVMPEGRIFFYLPLEHSEDLRHQQRCVALTSPIGNPEYTRYAIAHHDVIGRFGRFPHRNAILGRASTAEEIEFLKRPGSAF